MPPFNFTFFKSPRFPEPTDDVEMGQVINVCKHIPVPFLKRLTQV